MYFLDANCKMKLVKGDIGWKPLGNSFKKEENYGLEDATP
jgi:hypothetical protein